ncbi:MAG TPA: PIN domain-containing protein [Thermoanaerobaculia bacterium]|nr:PIN domain-containing protein [Thermoanaerobaculia bacterium]
MKPTRLFVDTSFVIALINKRDRNHEQATRLAAEYGSRRLLTTDAILLEIGNALARSFKPQAVEVIEHFLTSADVEVVRLDAETFESAFDLYRSHRDKSWGLIDCHSFVVMRQAKVENALDFDVHFGQAGFRSVR